MNDSKDIFSMSDEEFEEYMASIPGCCDIPRIVRRMNNDGWRSMDWTKASPETMPPENETVIVSVVMTGTTRPHHILWSGATWSKDNGWEIAETEHYLPLWVTERKTEVSFWRPFQNVNYEQRASIARELSKMLIEMEKD